MFKAVIGALAALAVTTPATAADWWFICSGGSAPRLALAFVDKAGIRDLGNGKKRAWTVQAFQNSGTVMFSSKALIEFDCSAMRNRLIATMAYSIDGDVVGRAPEDAEWNYLSPDSTGESMALFVCRGQLQERSSQLEAGTTPDRVAKKFFSEMSN